jgi:hypothetical protein
LSSRYLSAAPAIAEKPKAKSARRRTLQTKDPIELVRYIWRVLLLSWYSSCKNLLIFDCLFFLFRWLPLFSTNYRRSEPPTELRRFSTATRTGNPPWEFGWEQNGEAAMA